MTENEKRFWVMIPVEVPINKKTLGQMAWDHIESDMHLHDIEDLVCFYESEYDTLKDELPRDALEYYKIIIYLRGQKILINHCL